MNVHGLFLYKKRLSTHIKLRGNRTFLLKKNRGNRTFLLKKNRGNGIFLQKKIRELNFSHISISFSVIFRIFAAK